MERREERGERREERGEERRGEERRGEERRGEERAPHTPTLHPRAAANRLQILMCPLKALTCS